MISTTQGVRRRAAAVLAVPAVLLALAACGSAGSEGSATSEPAGPVATVSGKLGEQPRLTLDKDAQVGEETLVDVVRKGDGDPVRKGDFLRMDVLATTVQGEIELVNTWKSAEGGKPGASGDDGGSTSRKLVVTQAGAESALPEPVTAPLVGQKLGSRITVEGRASELLGPAAQQVGLAEDDGLVWVFDLVDAIPADAEVKGKQAPVEEGMPQVKAGGKQPATVTVPKGQDPPTTLREQVLIEGDGAEVRSGQTLIVQYTGVTWADGKVFDSSWNTGAASTFQIGVGQVVKGWDEGLVGKQVGDRVLLVLPPDMAYGKKGTDRIPANATLVFVVDIIGVA